MVELLEDERMDRLMRYDLDIIQSPSVFSFSIDALLLAEFAYVPSHDRAKIIDLCSGNGVVALSLSQKTQSKVYGVELQERLVDMAERSIQHNELLESVEMIQGDVKEAADWFGYDKVDVITCNPPYFKVDETSKKNPNRHKAIARHELTINLEDIIKVSGDLLKMRGRFFMVHRPERFLEILDLMKKYKITPKKVQFIYPKYGKEANMILIEGIKQGKIEGFKILPPVFIHDEEGEYLPEIKGMFYGDD